MAEGFGQYLEQVGPNRIKPVKQEIQDLEDPEEKMLMIIETLSGDLEIIPDIGGF